jgi:hypothetical protein
VPFAEPRVFDLRSDPSSPLNIARYIFYSVYYFKYEC